MTTSNLAASASSSFEPAARNHGITPFYVMELSKRVRELEAEGRRIVRLNVGEPDFGAPASVARALERALAAGANGYSDARGLYPLRTKIALYYQQMFGIDVPPERVVVTTGASGALVLACAALVERGSEILMSDPCYPCNRNFVIAFDGEPRLVETGPSERFQLTTELVKRHWSSRTRGVMITTPSNPTGTCLEQCELRKMMGFVRDRGGFVIVDEIYQGLTYSGRAHSALEIDDEVLVVNSFSKAFCLPGWRLGWMVAPERLVQVVERLSQSFYTCAATPLQHAAITCFDEESTAVYAERKSEFQRRRDFIVPALQQLGFVVPARPEGAFYVYADCSKFSADSDQFTKDVLNAAGVAIAPGKDFGRAVPGRYVRVSYANSMHNLEEGIDRLRRVLPELASRAA